jgi:hypothetical protein
MDEYKCSLITAPGNNSNPRVSSPAKLGGTSCFLQLPSSCRSSHLPLSSCWTRRRSEPANPLAFGFSRIFRYRFGNETKTFWYRSRICLVENRLLRFCSRVCSPGPNRNDLFRCGRFGYELRHYGSFLLDVGTFVERL